jgi:hypothetical protein
MHPAHSSRHLPSTQFIGNDAALEHRVIASHVAELHLMHGAAAFRSLTLDGERLKLTPEDLEAWIALHGVPVKGSLHVEVPCPMFCL